MNALQRDLKRLVPMVEAAGAARRKREQEREEKRNVMNSVRNMQRQAAAGESAYGGKRRAARSAMNTMCFISTARLTPREGSSTGGTCAAAICSTGNACP